MPKKTPWAEAAKDYATTTMTMADIAAKYKLSPDAVRKRGQREHWVAQRKAFRQQVSQKTIKKIASAEASRLANLDSASKGFEAFLLQIMSDEELRSIYITSGRDLKDYATALSTTEQVLRRLVDMPTGNEVRAYEMQQAKLALEREKAQAAKAPEHTEVRVIMDQEMEDWSG